MNEKPAFSCRAIFQQSLTRSTSILSQQQKNGNRSYKKGAFHFFARGVLDQGGSLLRG